MRSQSWHLPVPLSPAIQNVSRCGAGLCSSCRGHCHPFGQAEPVLVTRPAHRAGKQALIRLRENRRVDRGGRGRAGRISRDLRQRARAPRWAGAPALLIRLSPEPAVGQSRRVHTLPPHPDKITPEPWALFQSLKRPWGGRARSCPWDPCGSRVLVLAW